MAALSGVDSLPTPRPIVEVGRQLGLSDVDLEHYGQYKAKFSRQGLSRLSAMPRRGKLILVTAITPTKAGEGKTTVAIGLSQALCRKGRLSVAALRQPSLGPVFGQKGGATGGGKSTLRPASEINLHFTGDFHAIAAANNLLAAMTDNHLFHGNPLGIDPQTIAIHRALDMNDRSLREVVTEVGKGSGKIDRHAAFDITAASEVMAVFCLSQSVADLKKRLSEIVVARTTDGRPVTAKDLGAAEAMCALLVDAFRPNLAQTGEGTPAIVHGGPFANIAHGCSSVSGSRAALKLADYVITEAGFGSDLGFEKYCHIVAAGNEDLVPDAVVVIVTIKALKLHGGVPAKELDAVNAGAVSKGLANLERHLQIVRDTGLPAVVALNKFAGDAAEEMAVVSEFAAKNGIQCCAIDIWNEGGAGAVNLAEAVEAVCRTRSQFKPFYDRNASVAEKLAGLNAHIYKAANFEWTSEARETLAWLEAHGYGQLPICVAKTQYSLSDNPLLLGAPEGFTMTISDLHLSAGAGFVVVRMGDISTMPGLPAHPHALDVVVDDEGNISHLC